MISESGTAKLRAPFLNTKALNLKWGITKTKSDCWPHNYKNLTISSRKETDKLLHSNNKNLNFTVKSIITKTTKWRLLKINNLLLECRMEITIWRRKLIIGNKNIGKLIIKLVILRIISLEITKKKKNWAVWSRIKITSMRNWDLNTPDSNRKSERKMNWK